MLLSAETLQYTRFGLASLAEIHEVCENDSTKTAGYKGGRASTDRLNSKSPDSFYLIFIINHDTHFVNSYGQSERNERGKFFGGGTRMNIF